MTRTVLYSRTALKKKYDFWKKASALAMLPFAWNMLYTIKLIIDLNDYYTFAGTSKAIFSIIIMGIGAFHSMRGMNKKYEKEDSDKYKFYPIFSYLVDIGFVIFGMYLMSTTGLEPENLYGFACVYLVTLAHVMWRQLGYEYVLTHPEENKSV